MQQHQIPLRPHSTALVLALLALCVSARAKAQEPAKKVTVVTTLGILADLAREVGGDHVTVEALADPRQDPHFVQPRPTLMRKAHDADLFVELGLQLELWAGKVIEGSGNPGIQSGQPGRVVASLGISTLELPQQLSRDWGDVHPFGNPHVWLDPLNVKDMAANIEAGLVRVDPAHKEAYEEHLKDFQRRIDDALFGAALVEEVGGKMLTRQARRGQLAKWLESKELGDSLGGWLARAKPIAGRPIVTYHKSWIYFTERFGLTTVAEIEEKPGIPPSARHRDALVGTIREKGVRTILEGIFYDRSAGDYLARETGAHVVAVPIDVGVESAAGSYFELIDHILNELLAAEAGADPEG